MYALREIFVLLTAMNVTLAIKCYQGRYSLLKGNKFPSGPTECLPDAFSCFAEFLNKHNAVQLGCVTGMCKKNGTIEAQGYCKMMKPTIEFCCCYGDGCNVVRALKLRVKERDEPRVDARESLSSVVARRIEDFYDTDAKSSEKAFIRRVVQNLDAHIRTVKKNERLLPLFDEKVDEPL